MQRAAAVLVLLLAGSVGAALPALAHESDPRISTSLDQVVPALPDDVVVQVQAGIATQLVVSNPTQTVLEVIGSRGRPFLRLSGAGVLADLGAEEFFTTSNPNGTAPSGAGDEPPRWVQISSGTSWGWYDHRLHPAELAAPADATRVSQLATFEVPLRYGRQEVRVNGTVSFQPLLGGFQVSADAAPAGVSVQALPGRLPALFLTAEPGTQVAVVGRDGEPFLRITAEGVEVNQSSRTHVEDRQARGEQVGPPSPVPSFRLVAPGARSYTWLDERLRYPADLPPEEVLRADGPTVVDRWEVPVEVGGRAAALTGDVTWVPEADAAARVGAAAAPSEQGASLLPYAVGGALLALAAAVLGLRARRSAQSAG
jgi:hypothetical protein